jgi:4-carboxymuconolactone decarboxylase
MKSASSGSIQEMLMKLFAAAVATASLIVSSVAQARELKMKEDMRMVAPALEKYTQNKLLGEVWKRPGLSARDRSVVTLAALIARGQTIELRSISIWHSIMA